jgi:TolA-binding protein
VSRPRLHRCALLGAALLVAGCGAADRAAERYRAEQMAYSAQRAEREVSLGGRNTDSTALLDLRRGYMRMREIGHPPYLSGSTPRERSLGRDVLQLIASGEEQASRLALMARRPDLALENSRWIQEHAEGDLGVERQADFVAIGALRMSGRADEAVERLRGMLRRYEPAPPPRGTSLEDPILALPEMIVMIRREQGDEAAAAREIDAGLAYYEELLRRPREPMLESLIRARMVRSDLELKRGAAALEQVNALERLVAAHPELRPLEPEIRYSRAKIRAMTESDRSEAIVMLDRFAVDYPKHNLAPRAIFDAAVFLEDGKRYLDALARYRKVVAIYPRNEELAPVALFREAMLEERTGDWEQAKATLESVPVKYPRSQAAVEAPFAIAQRYYARGEKDAAKAALARAIVTYQQMISKDASSAFAAACRYNILRGQFSLGEWDKALTTIDDMVANNPRHPYTAQALLEGSKVAAANRQKDRAAGYLQQYLENFPNSPLAAQVRAQKEKLLK